MTTNKIFIYGKHALYEALLNAPDAIRRVFVATYMDDAKLRDLLRKNKIPIAELNSKSVQGDLERNAAHQGVIAQISLEHLVHSYDRFMEKFEPNKDSCFVLLDELQDPHNVGAIIRSAAAFGVSAVLVPERKQAPITGTVVKVSAGMAFRVPIVKIGNVNNTIRDLKKRGFWIYGLAGEGAKNISEEKFNEPTLFVMGNEGEGIREKTRESCDELLSIPMSPKCESLNVAASAAVALFAWSSNHPNSLK